MQILNIVQRGAVPITALCFTANNAVLFQVVAVLSPLGKSLGSTQPMCGATKLTSTLRTP